eukprot:8760717-Ditylum_brightwellii.AAC.1
MAIKRKDELSDRDKDFLVGKDCEEMVMSTKIKLAAATCRLWKHKEKFNQTRNNKLFEKSNKHLYDSLKSSSGSVTDPLLQEETSLFWSKVFGKTAKHNDEAV